MCTALKLWFAGLNAEGIFQKHHFVFLLSLVHLNVTECRVDSHSLFCGCRWDEMLFSTAVMLFQVGVAAYILGTLFHYVVKKDAKLQAFR